MEKLCITYDDELNISIKILDKTTWERLDTFLKENESNYLYTIERDDGDYIFTGRHLRKYLAVSSNFINIEIIEEMFPDGIFCGINMINTLLQMINN